MSAAPDLSSLVHRGHHPWLFLVGGSNFVTELYQRDGGHLPDVKLALWRDAIVERKRRCDAIGAAYAHVIAPEKLTIYGHKIREKICDVDLAPAIRMRSLFEPDAQSFGLVDLVAPMRKYRDHCALYYHTDTHWSPEGCLVAYKVLCDALGIDWNPDLVTRPQQIFPTLMDLGSKVDPPAWEWVRQFTWTRDAKRVYANRVVQILETPTFGGEIHVGCYAVFTNDKATSDRKVLLFGDSFSAVGPHMLTAVLAETVRELHFVWSANIDWRLVERLKPDIVVTEIAERFMAIAPNDRFNLNRTVRQQVVRAYRRRFEIWRASLRKRISFAKAKAD